MDKSMMRSGGSVQATPAKGLNAGRPGANGKKVEPPEETGPSAEELHGMMVASTFANLELTTTQQTLNEVQRRYLEAMQENTKLTDELKTRDRDAMHVVEFLRKELDKKNARVAALEQQLSTVHEDFEDEKQRAKTGFEAQIGQRDVALKDANAEIKRLQKELEAVTLYKRERQEVLLEISRTKEAHAEMVNKYEKELTKLRFQGLEEKVRLRAAEKEMVDKFNEEVDARAMVLVDVKAKGIHEENKRLAIDKTALREEVDGLIVSAQTARDQLVRAQREVDLGIQTQEAFAKRGATVARGAKQANARVHQLEDTLSETVATFENRLKQLDDVSNAEHKHLSDLAVSAKEKTKWYRHELVRTRKLARHVVQQRTELENFFHDALQYVRENAVVEASAASAPVPSPRQQLKTRKPALPSIRLTSSAAHSAPSSARAPKRPLNLYGPDQSTTTDMTADALQKTAKARETRRRQSGAQYIGTLASGSSLYSPRGVSADGPRRTTAASKHPIVANTQNRSEHRFFSQKGDEMPLTPTAAAEAGQLVPTPSVDDDGPDFAMQGLKTQAGDSLGFMPPSEAATSAAFTNLSWNDKERVIQALLYKINTAYYVKPDPTNKMRQASQPDIRSGGQGGSGAPYLPPMPPGDHEEFGDGDDGYEPVDLDEDPTDSFPAPPHSDQNSAPDSRLDEYDEQADRLYPHPNTRQGSASDGTTFVTQQQSSLSGSAHSSRPGTRGAPINVAPPSRGTSAPKKPAEAPGSGLPPTRKLSGAAGRPPVHPPSKQPTKEPELNPAADP